MNTAHIGAQLYTIRDHLQSPAAIAQSMKRIRAIGFRAVQVSGMGPIDEAELLSILDGEGLTCCATHENGDTILNDPATVIERLTKLRCTLTAYPFPAEIDFGDAAAIASFCEKLERAGAMMREAGITLMYHNHNHEFRKSNNKIILDTIYRTTNPQHLQGEPDTYWVAAGGCCPAAWCRKLSGRLPLLHMKDGKINGENQFVLTEVGNGNLDWQSICREAEKSGCEWFVIEQDNNWLNNDPFLSLQRSYEYVCNELCDNEHPHSFTRANH